MQNVYIENNISKYTCIHIIRMEIKVIKDTTDVADITRMSTEDREAMFERIAKNCPQLSLATLDSFSQLLMNFTKDKISFTRPTILELVLRHIIQSSSTSSTRLSNFVMPIIHSYAHVHAQPDNNPTADISADKTGSAPGAFMRNWKKVAKPTAVVEGAIRIRFDDRILAITTAGSAYVVPANEELNVVGLFVNVAAADDDIDPDRFLLGNYDYTYATGAYFLLPKYVLRIAGREYSSTVKFSLTSAEASDHNSSMQLANDIYEHVMQRKLDVGRQAAAYYMQIMAAMRDLGVARAPLRAIFRAQPVFKLADILDVELPATLGKLSEVFPGTLSVVYEMNVLADLDSYGLLSAYNWTRVEGPESDEAIAVVNNFRARQERVAYRQRLRNAAAAERNRETLYKLLAERKFGQKRYAELVHQAAGKSIISSMKANEKKLVLDEYERRMKYYEAFVNNKCPHKPLLRAFRNSINDRDAQAAYEKLARMLVVDSPMQMVKCAKCDFDVICPHVLLMHKMEQAHERQVAVSDALIKYIDDLPIHDRYFCKVCGELLSQEFPTVRTTEDMSEELKNMIYGEIMFEMRYLKFASAVNVQQLVNNIRNTIYPHIAEIERQILKSRTASVEEVKSKKKLYISIYCFAYLINLVAEQSRGAASISFRGIKPSKNVVVELVKHVLGLLISSKNVVIRNIPGMTPDIIKNKLVEAYKIMSKVKFDAYYSLDTEAIATTVGLDPVYRYLCDAHTVHDLSAAKSGHKRRQPADLIEEYLGASLKQLESSKGIYSGAPKVSLSDKLAAEFDALKPLTVADMKSPNTFAKLRVAKLYTGLWVRSFQYFWKNVSMRLYARDTPGTEVDVSAQDYHDEFLQLQIQENTYRDIVKLLSSHNIQCTTATKTLQYVPVTVGLGRKYDESGRPHKFDILLLDGQETPMRDVIKGIQTERLAAKITDRKCSVCDVLRSECESLSDAAIKQSLSDRADVENFFRFYENRCPKGGMHDFTAAKCPKCHLTTEMITKMNRDYYNEYRKKYHEERAEFKTEASLEFPEPAPFVTYDEYESEIATWVFNFDIVLELSEKLGINHRLIMCLGATEQVDYNDILNDKYIPTEVSSRDDTRIYTLNGYVKEFLLEYNRLRFFSRNPAPGQALISLIEESGINRDQLSLVEKHLHDIYDDHNKKFVKVMRIRKPREIVEYCIQKLCTYALKLYDDPTGDVVQTLRKSFVKMVIGKFIRGDELLTKYGHFNWSVLYPDQNKIETKERDANFGELDDEPEHAEEDDTEREFGATNEIFKHAEDLDVDFEQSGEDDHNQIKVEGYELD